MSTISQLLGLPCLLLLTGAALNLPRSGTALALFGAGAAVGGAAICLSVQVLLS